MRAARLDAVKVAFDQNAPPELIRHAVIKARLKSLRSLDLTRLAGLPPNEQYEISDAIPFSEGPPLTFEEALKQAFEQRSDLKAAQAQVEAAERSRSTARSERLPSFAVRADYGVIGVNPSQAHGTFGCLRQAAATTLRWSNLRRHCRQPTPITSTAYSPTTLRS